MQLGFYAALSFMGRVLQVAPDREYLQDLRRLKQEFFDWPGVPAQDAKALRQTVHGKLSELVPALAEDHARLFSGPAPLASPWESVWLEREKLLFGEKTRQVEALYADWDVTYVNQLREPADHLGLEFGFLMYLLCLDLMQLQKSSVSGTSLAVAINDLYVNHITQFAPQLLEQAANAARTDFYRLACQNCQKMLAEFAKELP